MFVPEVLFERSWALCLAAVALPFFILRSMMVRHRAVAYAPLQYHPLPLWRRAAIYFAPALESLVVVLLALALAGPFTTATRRVISDKGVDIALVLDVSGSMQAADFKPNRLEALKRIASDFVKRGGSNRIAVYAFARHVFTQTPLTTDHTVILDLIDGIAFEMIDHVKSGGTAIGDALLMAADGLARHRIAGRDQAIILITDGESNMGIDPMLAAKVVRENGVRLYVIGVGGSEPVEVYVNGKPFITTAGTILKTALRDGQLKEIAWRAGGRYYRAGSDHALAAIFKEIDRLEKTPLRVQRAEFMTSFRPQCALIAFVLFTAVIVIDGLFLRRPYR